MEDTMTTRLRDKNIWMRGLYMLLFIIAYAVAETVLTLIVLFQFLAALFTGRVNESLLTLGSNLSAYVYQVLRFMTFNDETKPYPFGDWPDDPAGEGPWRRGPTAAHVVETPGPDVPAEPDQADPDQPDPNQPNTNPA